MFLSPVCLRLSSSDPGARDRELCSGGTRRLGLPILASTDQLQKGVAGEACVPEVPFSGWVVGMGTQWG